MFAYTRVAKLFNNGCHSINNSDSSKLHIYFGYDIHRTSFLTYQPIKYDKVSWRMCASPVLITTNKPFDQIVKRPLCRNTPWWIIS